ncbi:MAG: 4Fe-4S binding protein [Desulfatitalea sp.]|nr:4Fe-4S binding protein [Desulfatitalea sp.]
MYGIGVSLKQPRHLVQLAALLLTLAIGLQFYIYFHQASGTGVVTVQRPAGVEGFLPIGALMGWKRFALTGQWDGIHPAAMVILGWAAAISLLLRKSFCGWFCPIGTVSEACWRLGRRLLGRNRPLPAWLDIPLRSLKYLLLGFFVWVIFTMSVTEIAAFMHSPYYRLSDVKMLHFFTRMSPLVAGVLAFLLAASLLVQNFWCRYLCPYGALLGLFAMAGPTRVRRDEKHCTACRRCDASAAWIAPRPVRRKMPWRSPAPACTAASGPRFGPAYLSPSSSC